MDCAGNNVSLGNDYNEVTNELVPDKLLAITAALISDVMHCTSYFQ